MTTKKHSASTARKATKTPHQVRVEDFMLHAGQELPTSPAVPAEKIRLLRIRLLLEELFETAKAFGISMSLDYVDHTEHGPVTLDYDNISFKVVSEFDMIKAVDGLADLSVVTTGSLSALGVADGDVLHEVDRSNMEKFGPGGRLDVHGKWQKPRGHKPPDFEGVLRKQGWVDGGQ